MENLQTKNINALKQGILEIDRHLNKIHNDGRQVFLETNPNNLSRIFHDCSDERKGFVFWKGALEEMLV